VLIHINCGGHDVRLTERRSHRVEELKVELVLSPSEMRVVTECATSLCTMTLVDQRLLVTTGSHVFLCDNQRIAFEAVAVSEVTPRPVISSVRAVDKRVVLGTEFEVFFLDLRAEPPRLIRRLTAASGLIEDIRFDGRLLEVRDEGGNISTLPFE